MRPSLSSGRRPRGSPALIALLLATSTALLPSAMAQDTQKCYWPDGSETSDSFKPCRNVDTGFSTCCSDGWTCLSNGLCMAAGQNPNNLAEASIVQGGCTDSTWATTDCESWCTDEDDLEDLLNQTQPIRRCPNSADTFYCVLADDHDDCDEEDEIIRFPNDLTIMTTIGVPETTSSSSSSSSTTSSASGTSSTDDPSQTSSDLGPSDSLPPGGGGDDSGGDSGPDPLAIGLGVGIGVGGLGIVLAVVFFLLWRRKSRKAAAAAAAAAAGNEEGAGDGEKGGAGFASSPSSGVNELPATLSKNVHEASPDAMLAEAPSGDQRLGRVEAPPNELRYEIGTEEGTQGRHELVGSEVPAAGTGAAAAHRGNNVSPTYGSSGDASPQDCSTLGTSTLDASTLGNSVSEVSPIAPSPSSPTNIPRKPVA